MNFYERVLELKTLGDRLKYLREREDLKQTELVKKFSELSFNITSAAISQYESNKRVPDTAVLAMYADYFDVTIDWLYGRVRSSNETSNDPKVLYSKEELLPLVPEEYRELFAEQNMKYIEFAKEMKEEDINPDDLVEGLKIYIEVKKKYKKNK